jgi:hypothetical protein
MHTIDINALHTTPLGVERIRRNLNLEADDVVEWCKQSVLSTSTDAVTRKGKNWYVNGEGFILTINAHSHTIITAHKSK